ncbi:hypothetical protein C8F04DRAFT_1188545 [Mycena alexandri]|uniref:Uncharacterized protein n=1 Tax=Mycena alexandri TaxID=1745969 RepID=A0AAD6SIC0_9AGAR|nr:hypothetical protein C8F04DRAFT_1188545 [Mycena alexandri]
MSLYPVRLQQPNPALFDAKVATIQRNAKELVIFCSQLNVSPMVNGNCVPPEYIYDYLSRLGIFWPCFCTMHDSEWTAINNDADNIPKPLSSRILTWGKEGVYAVCHYDNPRCQFFIDLKRIYQTSQKAETYVPMGPKESALSRLLASSYVPSSPAPQLPYLPGFLGDKGVQLGAKKLAYFNDVNWFLLPYVGFQNTTLIARSMSRLIERNTLYIE